MLRQLVCCILLLTLVTAVWAKDKVTLKSLMAKSDAIYYSPAAHGVTDLAVDIVVEQLAKDPVGKDAQVTYYFGGEDRQRVVVQNVPDKYTAYREALLNLLSPISQYVMPHSSSASFAGMTLKIERVSRQLVGVADTTFYQIIGVTPGEQGDLLRYQVLLDKNGLVHQIENVYKNGAVTASIENTKVKEGWVVTSFNTRMGTKDEGLWKIERVEYETIEGYTLPVRCTVQYRNLFNKPVRGRDDLTIHLKNYRINQGIAVNAITKLEKDAAAAATPAP